MTLTEYKYANIVVSGNISAINVTGDNLVITGDISANNLVITGDISANNLVITEDISANNFIGQLLTFHGETDGTLTNFPFAYGSSEKSSSIFGMVCPIACKLVRFSYECTNQNSNTAFDSSSVIVFELWQNNSAKTCYAYCDFSNTTNGSISFKRFTNKFSSSPTSQVDIDSFDLGTASSGVPFCWKVYSTTETTQIGHRFTTMVQTTEGI